ncbi:unnamed protein product [Leptosia nina]|uniref:Glucosylceramidase n=1 Tax=Leptosia nina TaxID=320188 RepID=A0AAV1IYM1_9NEOP
MDTKLVSLLSIVLSAICRADTDIPCNQRINDGYPNHIVCVCNATYCDTISRIEPKPGTYITYTSSQAGSRYLKGIGRIAKAIKTNDGTYEKVFEINPNKQYQTIFGFGGAVTDATAINFKVLPEGAQNNWLDSYFSEDGIKYNMLRIPIASSDFSETPYYYNEYPENDEDLTNFTYTPQDINYKIPLLLGAMETASEEVWALASTWSPPKWMKIVDEITATSRLKIEYYQTFADYHCNFIRLYEAAGVPIWGVTTSNEPIDGSMVSVPFGPQNTLGWTAFSMMKWLKNNFGPTMKSCNGKSRIILATDDQRYMLPLWADVIVAQEEVSQYVDGYALHAYADQSTPGDIVESNLKKSPTKFVLGTEFCHTGSGPKVDLGSWDRGELYAVTILDNLVNNYVGFIDWNMILDLQGGPNWSENYVDSPTIVNATSGEFYKQPMFYVMGHFSKWVPRGSKRISTVRRSPVKYTPDKNNIYDKSPERKDIYDHVAFLTPKNTIVVIIANYYDAQTAALLIGSKQVTVFLEAHSVVTVEFNNPIRSP